MKYENTSCDQNYGLGDYRVTCEMECREMHIYIFGIQNIVAIGHLEKMSKTSCVLI